MKNFYKDKKYYYYIHSPFYYDNSNYSNIPKVSKSEMRKTQIILKINMVKFYLMLLMIVLN